MKTKIVAIISFIGNMFFILFMGYELLIANELSNKTEDLLQFIFVSIVFLSTIFYIIGTNFGKDRKTDLDKIDYENKLLSKQIEQQELKKKLNN
jgi:amino acid permease